VAAQWRSLLIVGHTSHWNTTMLLGLSYHALSRLPPESPRSLSPWFTGHWVIVSGAWCGGSNNCPCPFVGCLGCHIVHYYCLSLAIIIIVIFIDYCFITEWSLLIAGWSTHRNTWSDYILFLVYYATIIVPFTTSHNHHHLQITSNTTSPPEPHHSKWGIPSH